MKLKTIVLTLLALGYLTNASFAQTELTDENAETKLLVNNDRLIVLDFYATWCGPCKRMKPIIKELEAEYPNVDFYKIDVDKNQVDDALGIAAMPTYLFIKNSSNLEQIEGAMSKTRMEGLIKKHMGNTGSETVNTSSDSYSYFDSNDFSETNIENNWNSWNNLNSLAWRVYENDNDVSKILRAIEVVERSIELDKNYYNLDTHAALLYKTGRYREALKRAKEAIEKAKEAEISYAGSTDLINKIIDKM